MLTKHLIHCLALPLCAISSLRAETPTFPAWNSLGEISDGDLKLARDATTPEEERIAALEKLAKAEAADATQLVPGLSEMVLRETKAEIRLAALRALTSLDFKDDPYALAALSIAGMEGGAAERALSSGQMKDARNFSHVWDFDTVWKLEEGGKYPTLREQPVADKAPDHVGSGTAEDPFLIGTPEQLDDIRNKLAPGAHFRQIRDIDLTGYGDPEAGWLPISGTLGSYDGGGFKTLNLHINRPRSANVGLFGTLKWEQGTPPARLSRIALENVSITGGNNVGALAGYLVHAGTAAAKNTVVENCYATGKVAGGNVVGGLAGVVFGCRVNDSYAVVEVAASAGSASPLVDRLWWGSLARNCFYDASVSGLKTIPALALRALEKSHPDFDISGHLYGLLRADDPGLRLRVAQLATARSGASILNTFADGMRLSSGTIAATIPPHPDLFGKGLIAALGDGRYDVRRLAAEVANSLEPEMMEKLIATLTAAYEVKSGAPENRIRLARAAGELRNEAIATLLLEMTADPSPEVRREAIESLHWLGLSDPAKENAIAAHTRWWQQRPELAGKVAPVLQALAKNDPDESCRKAAEAALIRISGGAAPEPVFPAALPIELPADLPETERELIEETYSKTRQCQEEVIGKFADQIGWPHGSRGHVIHGAANLYRNTHSEAANRVIMRHTEVSSEEVGGLGAPTWPIIYGLFNRHGHDPRFAGRLSPETEALFKERMLDFLRKQAREGGFEYINDVWSLKGTENHHFTFGPPLWYLFLGFLNQDAEYAKIVLHEGKTVAEWCGLWRGYMRDFLKERAMRGMWIEMGAGYMKYSLPAFFAQYVAAEDPVVRQRAKMFLDLAMVEEAQISYGYVRGGGKSRAGNGVGNSLAGMLPILYGDKAIYPGHVGTFEAAVCGYLPPPEAVLIQHRYQRPEKPIVIENRRPGEIDAEGKLVPAAELVNYCYKTRHFMLGAMQRAPDTKLTGLATQTMWGGLMFASGDGVYPHPVHKGGGRFVDPYHSFQHEGVMILRKNDGAYATGAVQIHVKPGTERVERDGWAFVNDGDAYVALRAVEGDHRWSEDGKYFITEQDLTPIIIHGSDVDGFATFEKFITATLSNKITWDGTRVIYEGSQQTRIEYPIRETGEPGKVAGKAYDFAPKTGYRSPHMNSEASGSKVRVTVGSLETVYDFETNEINRKVTGKNAD